MTMRTGKGSSGGMYRYYTCSTKARQGETGCKGRSIPMDKLDHLVVGHLEKRLLQPERLEAIACGWREAAIGGITCALSHSASRSPKKRFASWDRNQNCSKRS